LSGTLDGRVALLLSGEHPSLPSAEAVAVLEAEGVPYSPIANHDQLSILDVGAGFARALETRSAMVMEGGRLILVAEPSYDRINNSLVHADWGLLNGKSFGVKVTRVREYHQGLNTQRLQGEIGHAIIGQTDSRVDLRSPEIWIRGVVTNGGFFVFARMFATDRKSFGRRRPKSRPYFHPGVLEPKIARTFVNLSRIRTGGTFLDPFCGTGGFLIEAGLIGCDPFGVDLDPRMVRGAKTNLSHYGIEAQLVHGDARRVPLNRADGIATDPPYGRGASTMGGEVRQILLDFLEEAGGILPRGGFVCTAAPMELDPCVIAIEAGLTVREEHRMRVHKSLTRSIIVGERL